jgi:FixJ family two-component response regulator
MIQATPLIYIVDDDKSVRKSLKRLMKSAGLRAKTLASAEDFLNSGYQDDPGCLILDVRMPGLNGLDLQKQLTAAGSKLPIIFITAHLLSAIHIAFEQLKKNLPGVNQ